MRVFVAVELPETVRRALYQGTAPLRRSNASVRWVSPGNMHITLKFLGEITEGRAASVREAVMAVATRTPPFELALGSVGAFPNCNRPRVVWVGVQGGTRLLAELAGAVESALAAEGFPPEKRSFRAHLTLGRCKRPAALADVSSAAVPDDSFQVHRVVVMQSHLHPQGPRYEVFAACPLGG